VRDRHTPVCSTALVGGVGYRAGEENQGGCVAACAYSLNLAHFSFLPRMYTAGIDFPTTFAIRTFTVPKHLLPGWAKSVLLAWYVRRKPVPDLQTRCIAELVSVAG